jgi:hypothetical protein
MARAPYEVARLWAQDNFFPNRKMFHTRFAQVAKIAKNMGECGVYFARRSTCGRNKRHAALEKFMAPHSSSPMPLSSYGFKKPRQYSQFGIPECEYCRILCDLRDLSEAGVKISSHALAVAICV